MPIGFVWEDLYTKHNMGEYHVESPARLFAVKEVIEDMKVAVFLTKLSPKPASKEEIAWVHDENYIDDIESTAGQSVFLDPDTSTSPDTWAVACLAAGGAIACVDYVIGRPCVLVSRRIDVAEAEEHRRKDAETQGRQHGCFAFAFVRPPGHHAERDHAMGFCIFNNIAIAAEYALKKCGIKKIAILDYDIHHGNGTQNHFLERNDVLFASTHVQPFYPGSGRKDETGEGKGKGFTINVPLKAGDGDKEFYTAWQRIIPRVEEFAPELILVSAGFDAHKDDPLGVMRVTTDGYRRLAEQFIALAKKVCHGRIVFVLEGGYSLMAIKSCVRATLEEMF